VDVGRFWKRQQRNSSANAPETPHESPATNGPRPATAAEPAPTLVGTEAVQMAGTTTVGADNASAIFVDRRLTSGGMIELRGVLVAEPTNPVDANAIAVHVDGACIGYLPGFLAREIDLPAAVQHPCRVQLWAEPFQGSLRVLGWVADGDKAPVWPHSPSNPPAITPADQRAHRQAAVSKMVSDALEGTDPDRAAQFQAGVVNGRHYLELVEPIKDLKRQGRLEEALVLAYQAIQGAENDRDGREPAPGHTIQAAILFRKLGRRDEEIQVLERWLALCPPGHRESSEAYERLSKVKGK